MSDNAISLRSWAAISLFALALTGSIFPAADALRAHIAQRLQAQETTRDRLSLQLAQWRADAATARELGTTLSQEDIDGLLAPANRTDMTAQIEPLAAASRLTRVTYTLSPAKPWEGGEDFPGIQGVTQSELFIEADAPTDGDVFSFMHSMSALTGRLELMSLSLTRLDDRDDAPVAALNLHMKAHFVWTANDDEQK